jgi:hypothetical protein
LIKKFGIPWSYSPNFQQALGDFVPPNQRFLIDPVMDEVPLLVRDYNVRVTQNPKMLRNSGGRYVQSTGESVYAKRLTLQKLDHPHPCTNGQHLEDAGLFFGIAHGKSFD